MVAAKPGFASFVDMMNFWKTSYVAGQFKDAASVYTEDGVLTVVSDTYTGLQQIETFFTNFYEVTKSADFKVVETDANSKTVNGVYYLGEAGDFNFVITYSPESFKIVTEVVTPIECKNFQLYQLWVPVTVFVGLSRCPN